jgi:hypothetical protein
MSLTASCAATATSLAGSGEGEWRRGRGVEAGPRVKEGKGMGRKGWKGEWIAYVEVEL